MDNKTKETYVSPSLELWPLNPSLNILGCLSTELNLEGDIEGYESIGEF